MKLCNANNYFKNITNYHEKKVISHQLTIISEDSLEKNVAVTVVEIKDGKECRFNNDEREKEGGVFLLSISITKSTNTTEEKDSWLKYNWDYLKDKLNISTSLIFYISINEINVSNWRYCRKSQQ
ncbi:hypothetical protein [Yersinia intermedia]|uniref:hypothetical protein n=1 Tax=Yersinia intermedia TaxID=631 RepID=UPI000B660E55|nr:hypothetical protein [Yersinia intermedia]MCW8114282.1 hypothetical protein [Yersinia intermedia]MDA5519049.1 hypothetical protein [Yersinia intermedia]OWF85256.1 hypothetical protein B4916_23350 [Yersinia intermedia]